MQIPVNEKKGLTFARGLRSILRHDPDKIMVGEIRDPETAQIAVQSALTGHLVFTTVHANNVFDVLGRFLHMGLDPYNFVSSLNCVLAQRLVRKICPHCKRPVQYDRPILEEAGLDWQRYREFDFHEGSRLPECHGMGYFGRSAIIELLDLDDSLREMIVTPGAGFPAEKSGRPGWDRLSARSGAGEGLFRADHTQGNQPRDFCRTGGKPVIIRNYLGLDITAGELRAVSLRRKGRGALHDRRARSRDNRGPLVFPPCGSRISDGAAAAAEAFRKCSIRWPARGPGCTLASKSAGRILLTEVESAVQIPCRRAGNS